MAPCLVAVDRRDSALNIQTPQHYPVAMHVVVLPSVHLVMQLVWGMTATLTSQHTHGLHQASVLNTPIQQHYLPTLDLMLPSVHLVMQ